MLGNKRLVESHFCLSLIFWIRYSHIKNFKVIDKLYLLINMMFIIMFVLTYVCFLIFKCLLYCYTCND